MNGSPMLCESATPEEARALIAAQPGKWVIQQKIDGVRGVIRDGKLYDRRGKDITALFPEFVGIGAMRGEYDGEIVCTSGEFGDVAGRMHVKDPFARKILVKKNPAAFMLFDVVTPGLLGERLAVIGAMDGALPAWMCPVKSFVCDGEMFEKMWSEVLEKGLEGVVLKSVMSPYERKRSVSWKKCKAFLETTAIFIKLEEHPRGIRLETEDGRAITVNGAQASEVRNEFRRTGSVTCEVQYMRSPVGDSTAWRFPSYRGLT